MRPAARMQTIGTESAFEVSARARALEATGRSIIHLQIGEPDFDTPANVREAAKQALDEGATHYAPFPGIPQLREAIAEDATARKGFPVTSDRVFGVISVASSSTSSRKSFSIRIGIGTGVPPTKRTSDS